MPMRFLIELLTVIAVCNLMVAQSSQPAAKALTEPAHLNDFQAIEFRRSLRWPSAPYRRFWRQA